MAVELIWHVDENDVPIGAIERGESRKSGARFRIVRVIVEDNDGWILLQKRQLTKGTFPGCWDTSAGGNIDYGETYEAAAKRELMEETGIEAAVLEEVAYYYGETIDSSGKILNRFSKLYKAVVSRNTTLRLQPEEVAEFRWVTRDQLLDLLATGEVTDGLQQTAERYYKITL